MKLNCQNSVDTGNGFSTPVTDYSHVYLIDASAYIFRAYFAMFKAAKSRGNSFTRSDGMPTGAVMTFCSMLFKILREGTGGKDRADGPTHIGVIFDHKGDTFRNKIYPLYKANREAPPDDLVPQFALIREAVRAFGLTPLEQEGYEADDLIATYAHQAREIGAQVTIVSGDKDLMQLIGQGIRMLDPMPGNERSIGIDEVEKKFGVGPDKVVDVQALAGDTTDNVPGVPGIGIKTAAQLIQEFGDLETLLHKADQIKQKKRRENLLEFAEQARLSRRLVHLDCHAPLSVGLQELDLPEISGIKLIAFCKAMEFRTFTKRVADEFGVNADEIEADAAHRAAARPAGHDRPKQDHHEIASPAADVGSPSTVIGHNARQATETPIDVEVYETVTTPEALADWISAARDTGYVAFDTETNSLEAMRADLIGFSLATRPGRACYVPVAHALATNELNFNDDQVKLEQMPLHVALDMLKPLLEDPAVLKIGQNLKYDILVLKRYNIDLVTFDDTMLISYALDGGVGNQGMDELARRHLNHICISYKDVIAHAPGKKITDKSFADVPIGKATQYAGEDADVTLRLWLMLKPRLVAERMMTVYETLERPLVPVIVAMEQAGIAIDSAILARLSGAFAGRAAKLADEIYNLAGEKFNLSSPKQLGELLFDKLGLPGGKKTKSGQWETRANLLDDLAGNEDLPENARRLVHTMLEWRQLTKLRSTYTDSLPMHINPSTKRVHTSYAMASTTTGRLASTDPNLQNIPIRTMEGREIRTAFVAKNGNKLVSADYSQIELRVLAHIAEISQLQQAFDDGLDIHAKTASEMFGVPVAGMPAEIRRRAKAINFGIIYGISAFGLANQLGIPRQEAAIYIKTYFERFPGIKDYMEETKKVARANGYVETIFGRKIHYPEIDTRNPSKRGFFERAAINAPIQGSAADIIRRAMIRMPQALEKAGLVSARMLLQVHDELIFEVGEQDAAALLKLVTSVMESAPEPVLKLSVPLKVDANAADNWQAAH